MIQPQHSDDLDNDPFAFSEDVSGPVPGSNSDQSLWTGSYDTWAPRLSSSEENGRVVLRGRRSDIAQSILYHLGRPLRLDNHAFLLPIYNHQDTKIVLKCSRQVSKTTTIANLQILESVLRPHWRSLYVSPSAMQTRQYSNEKLRPTLVESPFIAKNYINKHVLDQVFEKTLANSSYMFLRYAFLTPARARGIPASRVFFDEAQDLLKDNIKIISQSLSASRLAAGVTGSELLAGTPLTFSNTLEEYWRWSTMNEWLVPCDHHTPRYWNMLDAANIGKVGLVCSKKDCGKPINPASGQWVSMQPGEPYQGYHITQLMVPWKQSEDAWKTEIVMPSKRWPEAKFNNEILGIAFDSASAPITRLDIDRCCFPAKRVSGYETKDFLAERTTQLGALRVFAGIDWGEGRSEGAIQAGKKRFASWTVLTMGCYLPDNSFWPFFMKRYSGKEIDPEAIVPDVLRLCSRFNVETIGVDWGHGWGVNSRLFTARGRNRVVQFAYSTNLHERKRWDQEAYKFIVNRNAVLSDLFLAIKEGRFTFPEWEVFEMFAKDILAEYVEYNERTRTMMFDHPIDQPDDALHSLVYCKLAADIALGRF